MRIAKSALPLSLLACLAARSLAVDLAAPRLEPEPPAAPAAAPAPTVLPQAEPAALAMVPQAAASLERTLAPAEAALPSSPRPEPAIDDAAPAAAAFDGAAARPWGMASYFSRLDDRIVRLQSRPRTFATVARMAPLVLLHNLSEPARWGAPGAIGVAAALPALRGHGLSVSADIGIWTGMMAGGMWLHELGHYLAGRWAGARMSWRGVLLGTAHFDQGSDRQRAWAVLGGPAANLALGLAATALSAILPPPIGHFAAGFAFANLAYGIGALVPLDSARGGGLAMTLWRRSR